MIRRWIQRLFTVNFKEGTIFPLCIDGKRIGYKEITHTYADENHILIHYKDAVNK